MRKELYINGVGKVTSYLEELPVKPGNASMGKLDVWKLAFDCKTCASGVIYLFRGDENLSCLEIILRFFESLYAISKSMDEHSQEYTNELELREVLGEHYAMVYKWAMIWCEIKKIDDPLEKVFLLERIN